MTDPRDSTHGDVHSEKVISDAYSFIWVGIPKAATRTFLTALAKPEQRMKEGPPWLVDEPPIDVGGRIVREALEDILVREPKYDSYFKFSFVRNPWDRVVSCYRDKIATDYEENRRRASRFSGISVGMSFVEFVEFLTETTEGSDESADRHWLSQYRFVTDRSGRLLVDFVGKLESLDEDWRQARDLAGLPPIELRKLNTRFGWEISDERLRIEAEGYRHQYDQRTRNMIQKRYAKDIELFGYDF